MIPRFFLFLLCASIYLSGWGKIIPYYKGGYSDLEIHSKIKWGQLENGLIYAIMPCKEPPGKISLRLYVDVGSLMEEEDEQGLAHFIEHLVFQGSENFPNGVVDYLQKLGLAYGADTNAHTSFNQTVYKLDVPKNNTDTLQTALNAMKDFANGALFPENKTKTERGVVLSEETARDSVNYREIKAYWSFILKGTLVPKRFPIGKRSIIQNIPSARIIDFYKKWYTPDRMVLVVTGDMDPIDIKERIESTFSSLPINKHIQADPQLGTLAQKEMTVKIHMDKEMSATHISLQTLIAKTQTGYDKKDFFTDVYTIMLNQMLNTRLSILKKELNTPFINSQASSSSYLNFFEVHKLDAVCEHKDWKPTLIKLENELKKALEYGFTAFEIQQAKNAVLLNLIQNTKNADTWRAQEWADQIVDSLTTLQPLLSPENELMLAKEALESFNQEKALNIIREIWSQKNFLIFISTPLDIEKQEVHNAHQESLLMPVDQPIEESAISFAYTCDKKTATITEQTYFEDLGIHKIIFKNNVQLNFKKTDFQNNEIQIAIRFGHGLLEENKEGLCLLAKMVFIQGGLEAHNIDILDQIFSGKKVNISLTVEDSAFILRANTTPEDLKENLELLLAYMQHPGYKPEALRQAHKDIEPLYRNIQQTPEGVFSNLGTRFLANGDIRFGLPQKEKLMTLTMDDLKSFLNKPLNNSPLEVSIVGDCDQEKTIQWVSEIFGTMPDRLRQGPPFLKERSVYFPSHIQRVEFPVKTDIEKGLIVLAWPIHETFDIQTIRRLNILSSLFRDKMIHTLRNEQGATYTPFFSVNMPITFPKYAYLYGGALSHPHNLELISEGIEMIAQDFTQKNIYPEDFERAIQPIIQNLDAYTRTNDYWLNSVLLGSQEYPEQLDWARTIYQDLNSISIQDIQKLAQKCFKDKGLKVLIVPQS